MQLLALVRLARFRCGPTLAFVATLAGVVACSTTTTSYIDVPVETIVDAGGFDTKPPGDSGLGILTFRPDTLFSGFDGVHTFRVPVAVYDSDTDLQVTGSDAAAVEIVPKKLTTPVRDGVTDTGKYFFVTVKRTGTVTLKATSRGRSAEAKITVVGYVVSRWAAGDARYKTGAAGEPPCTDCHVNGKAIDHSPAALATATDEKIGTTITTGIAPGGNAIKIDGKASHRWTVSDTEREGLITYLRALEPKGFQ